jgi:hypothetical protein
MVAPFNPPVNGEFYIDNDNGEFFLFESGAWNKKGRIVRASVVGLVSVGPFPFTPLQQFELAIGETGARYYDAFSTARSAVSCEYPTAASCDVIFTNNLAGYLSSGTDIICIAHFEGVAQEATLTFTDTTVPALAPLWVVMPASADASMAGLRALFAGEPI